MVVIIYVFIDDFVEKRLNYRQAHLAYISEFEAKGKIAAGGALSPSVCRGLILFRGTDEEALDFVLGDPYVQAKIVKDYVIGKWSLVIGDMVMQLKDQK